MPPPVPDRTPATPAPPIKRRPAVARPVLAPPPKPAHQDAALRLQAVAGNAAVARQLTGRRDERVPRGRAGLPLATSAAPAQGVARAEEGAGTPAPARDEGGGGGGGGILGTLAGWARRVPGYGLLALALGRDPISQAAVPRTAVNLVGGVMGLIPGGQAMFENLQRAGAVQRAFEWFEAEVPKLGITWDAIRSLFSRAWDAIGALDLLRGPGHVWDRILGVFRPTLDRLLAFAGAAAGKVLEFVFEGAMSLAGSAGSAVMGVIRQAGGVLRTIVNDPIGFAGNLVAAVRGGLGRFMANIGTHLRTGLFAWLTGALRGAISLPARFDLRGILSMVVQILGLTWTAVRTRLVRLIGEPAVRAVETAVDWIQRIATGGLAAAADRILEYASGLVDTVIGGIRDWVARSVVGAAVTKLITMFNPAGAVIQSIIAVYNTVQFFIERAQQLAALAQSVFSSIAAIASGNLGGAITAVENALARTLPVVLGFLARLIGLGDVGGAVRGIITRVRAVVDRALDRVIDWVAGMGRRLAGGASSQRPASGQAPLTPAKEQAVRAVDALGSRLESQAMTRQEVEIEAAGLRSRFPAFQSLTVVELGDRWHLAYVINPQGRRQGPKKRTARKSFSLAPGGFAAHEHLQIKLPGGTIKTVHLITEHGEAVPDSRLADRIINEGKRRVTRFKERFMEESLLRAIAMNQQRIDKTFIDATGQARPIGTVCKIRLRFPGSIGFGMERNPQTGRIRPITALAGVEIILRVSDPDEYQFVVETGYATP